MLSPLAFLLHSLPPPRRRPRSTTFRCSKNPPLSQPPRAIVIGAGIAGLSASLTLSTSFSVTLLEASDAVGGRVRTDFHKGYTLDRGFQVFLEGYPSARQTLNYSSLDLHSFLPGAIIRYRNSFSTVSDPFRAPSLALRALFAPVGGLLDKVRVAMLRAELISKSVDEVLDERVESLALDAYLRKKGFSQRFISTFFRPFYQGIFLAPLSEQTQRMFEFVFRTFAVAPASLPARGIGAVAEQMSQALPANVDMRLNTRVTELGEGFVRINGEELKADVVVVATEGPEAVRLLGGRIETSSSRGSICLYFGKKGKSPVGRPILVLNGDEGDGPVNNMFVASDVVPEFAPKGYALISTTVVGNAQGYTDEMLEREVREQMGRWFGQEEVTNWELLRIYRIPHSQTAQGPDFTFDKETTMGGGVFVCGDHRNSPTLHGAIVSGRQAAERALAYCVQGNV